MNGTLKSSWEHYFGAAVMIYRSSCERLHVGCAVKDTRIISMGYNDF